MDVVHARSTLLCFNLNCNFSSPRIVSSSLDSNLRENIIQEIFYHSYRTNWINLRNDFSSKKFLVNEITERNSDDDDEEEEEEEEEEKDEEEEKKRE